MSATFTIEDVCEAAGITRSQFSQWISRDYVSWLAPVPEGQARAYELGDIFTITVLIEIVRLGLPPAAAGRLFKDLRLWHLHGFNDDQAVLVIWQGPAALAGCGEFWRGGIEPIHQAKIVRTRDFPSLVRDSHKRSLIAVNLDHVWDRVRAALGVAED